MVPLVRIIFRFGDENGARLTVTYRLCGEVQRTNAAANRKFDRSTGFLLIIFPFFFPGQICHDICQ